MSEVMNVLSDECRGDECQDNLFSLFFGTGAFKAAQP